MTEEEFEERQPIAVANTPIKDIAWQIILDFQHMDEVKLHVTETYMPNAERLVRLFNALGLREQKDSRRKVPTYSMRVECLDCGICLNCGICRKCGTPFRLDEPQRRIVCKKCGSDYMKFTLVKREGPEMICPKCGSKGIRNTRFNTPPEKIDDSNIMCPRCGSKNIKKPYFKPRLMVNEIVLEKMEFLQK